jgi:hypothetical protein
MTPESAACLPLVSDEPDAGSSADHMRRLELTADQRALIGRFAALAREGFAPRAAHYDRTATFPSADFDDLFREGLNAPTAPIQYGGLGLGPHRGDAFTLWMITKEIAKADLSMARCWEGHANSLLLLDGMATEVQKARWFEGVVDRGDKWVAWSGEPQARAPGESRSYGTSVTRVAGGYVVDGTKFATSATAAQWAILLVSLDGPGGIRHARGGTDSQLLLGCGLSDPSVTPTARGGIRSGCATVSYLVRFDRTFIPEANAIGYPGQYTKDVADLFHPHYAATFLGAAEAARIRDRLPDVAAQPTILHPASHRVDVDRRRDRASLAAPCGASVGGGTLGGRAAGRQPVAPCDRASRGRRRQALHPRLRRAVAESSGGARADLSRSVVLRPSRQRRSPPRHDRKGAAGSAV